MNPTMTDEARAAWGEYDSAADWCAARGVKGEPADRLPMGISERAAKLIRDDPEAFERRVKECAYARAQKQWDSLHETPESPLCFCGKPHLHGNPTCGRIQCGLSAFPTIADYARMSPSRPIAVMTEHATREGWEGPFVVREYVALPGDKINYHAIESGDGVCTCGRESRYLAEQDCQALNAAFALGCAVGHGLGEVVRGVTSTPGQVVPDGSQGPEGSPDTPKSGGQPLRHNQSTPLSHGAP